MLTDDAVTHRWATTTGSGWARPTRTHRSQIDTYNINDMITCTREATTATTESIRPWRRSGITRIRCSCGSSPCRKIDFDTVTADFERLKTMAIDAGSSYPKVAPATQNGAHGWYIKLGSGNTYQVAKVTAEYESYNYNVGGPEWGGYLRYAYTTGQNGSLSPRSRIRPTA